MYFISANPIGGLFTFPNVHSYSNVNGIWELPTTTEPSEFNSQTELFDSLYPREESFSSSTQFTYRDSNSHVKFISDFQMHELHTLIYANGNGFKGEFTVGKQIIIDKSYLIVFYCSDMFL